MGARTRRIREALFGGWSVPLVVLALLAVVGGGLAGAPLGERVYDYQWSDARFCNDCHAHDYANEAWERSAHADLTTCHDCHRVPIRHYPRNLWVMLTRPPQSAADIPRPEVPLVICASCHVGSPDPHELSGPLSVELCERVVKIDGSRLHQLHLRSSRRDPGPGGGAHAAPDGPIRAVGDGGPSLTARTAATEITCTDCHGAGEGEVHRFAADPAACVRCHERMGSDLGMPQLGCRQCHGAGFLGGAPAPSPGHDDRQGPGP